VNITTNTLLMIGANRCIDRRLVNEPLRRGAKKNFYVALLICAIGWAQGTSFPQATKASVGPQSPAASPAGSAILTSTLVLGKLTSCSSHIRYPVPLPGSSSTVL
jgi:hypothetical protein